MRALASLSHLLRGWHYGSCMGRGRDGSSVREDSKRPSHRSRRVELQHRALTLGEWCQSDDRAKDERFEPQESSARRYDSCVPS